MTSQQLADAVQSQLPYSPNTQQEALIGALARFCEGLSGEVDDRQPTQQSQPTQDRVFVLNGYAGTGKTSLVSALVRALKQFKVNVVLMAPTGRAAKVFAHYSGFAAATIHRRIYRHSLRGEIPGLKENRDNNTLYIVDEASMIGSGSDAYSGDLLTDLFTYVFAGINNRLIFMGDTAQLPPVGDSDSPAMDAFALKERGFKISAATLTRVVRQGARSGIMANAVNIRRMMYEKPDKIPVPLTEGFDDVSTITAVDMAEAIDHAYRTAGIDDTIIITRSNRRAADFNKAIRAEVLYIDEELAQGEPLLVVKNNYYWTRVAKRRDIDFLANGDIMRVTKVIGTELKYGFWFADVEFVPVENDMDADSGETVETPPIQAKIFLETLIGEHPALPYERQKLLFDRIVQREYPGHPNPMQALADNPYWNALQTKFAYCVTCHKAQGGQWSRVFVDVAYINPDAVGPELYRWMYTATTRARHHLTYLVDTSHDS
ncbi:MAG: AAA family ATPase [Muribaculaceae bacterium]|nr:AAA family ATPase [Muribaculaceae bacterium]